MKMNLPNKITISRIILAVIMIFLMLIPWYDLGIIFPEYIASITDFIDGYIARSRNLVTDFGKITDAIADKILVNGLIIILAYERMIPLVVPVVIVIRDIVVDSCKMVIGSKGKAVGASILGKIKTICMMVGLTLLLFANVPFTYIDFPLDKLLILIGTILSVLSGSQYFLEATDNFNYKK